MSKTIIKTVSGTVQMTNGKFYAEYMPNKDMIIYTNGHMRVITTYAHRSSAVRAFDRFVATH